MSDVGEPGIARDLFGPALHCLAFHLDAATAVAAGQVVMMGIGAAPPVEGLAARAGNRVDLTGFAEHLEVPVDGGQADVLSSPAQLRVNLLGAAESGQPVKRSRQDFGLPSAADPRAARGGGRSGGLR